jgi:hypothetical protein
MFRVSLAKIDRLLEKFLKSDLEEDEILELSELIDEARKSEEGFDLKSRIFELGGNQHDYNRLRMRLFRRKKKEPQEEEPLEAAKRKVEVEESKYLREKIEKDFETIRKIEDVLSKYSKDLKAEGRPFEEVIDSALDFYFSNRDEVEALRMKVEQYRALCATLAEVTRPEFREAVISRLYCDLIVQLVTLKARGYDITPEDVLEAIKAVRGGIGMVYAENQLLKALLRATGEGQRYDASGHGKAPPEEGSG